MIILLLVNKRGSYWLFLLQIGLAVGDIQAIYDMANFEKQALQVSHIIIIINDNLKLIHPRNNYYCCFRQVDYILNVEDQLRRFGFTAKNKAYHDYSLPEMIFNRLIVLLWGGESRV